ncbi:hypothetical protein Namu_0481 [Nakamurella multipartita DSM 44233]|uniref:Uncharacterized protein n=2 Tax=Nakamurella TaxID=53460 RepID=C8X731_NAKMY|nr:hypothetical protein Namu_0481 [Nakamurella multipartita DSM 44233]
MRSIRRIGVTGATVVALMGMGMGVASAQSKASAEQDGGIYFAGHASGSLTKASGGFEVYDTGPTDYEPWEYLSGKVICYSQNAAATKAVFTARVTKGDLDKAKTITFWFNDSDAPVMPNSFGYAVDVPGAPCTGTPQNVKSIEDGEGYYIDIR